ncbi:MAG: DUF2147 domain-containing protein [Paludibacteraceae bacterium]|jgi:uncharacterized protein (DUF2147 family)|nr:DUF2147 domain-containing protein [Paludibacteraceae bacterium]MBQ5625437.1 DUF2147 domain-containing protein [Paludibacteraceae bacterium]
MKKKLYFLLASLVMSACLWAQTPILGEWITVDDATGEHKSVVRIYQADNGMYYGQIVALLEENSDTAVCTACVGEDHNQPIVGLTIIRDMQLKDGELRGGKVLDPDNGKFYYAKVFLKDGKLILRGSLDKAGLLGRSQTWLPKN